MFTEDARHRGTVWPPVVLLSTVIFLGREAMAASELVQKTVTIVPTNLFTFDPDPYSNGYYRGSVCITNHTRYQPACQDSNVYDGKLMLGMTSSYALNNQPKWSGAAVVHDSRTSWLPVPTWEQIVSMDYCMGLYLPTENRTTVPNVFVAFICECGETAHDKCQEKEKFVTTTTVSKTESVQSASLVKSTAVISKSTSPAQPTLYHSLNNPKGCTIISATTGFPVARTRSECLYFCLEFTIHSTSHACWGIFHWEDTGKCWGVLKYDFTNNMAEGCEFWAYTKPTTKV